jgi:hypothetical protein
MSRPCYVYVIGHAHETFGHAVKIGITESIGSRLAQLQTGSCEDLTLFFAFQLPGRNIAARVESEFHEKFEDWRIRGEWFGMHPNGAIMLLTFFIADILPKHYAREHLSDLRREAGLLDAFEVLDVLPDEFHAKWNHEWHTHVVEYPQ